MRDPFHDVALDRVRTIATLLRAARPFTSTRLIDELGVSRRTVVRDIATMRSLGWAVAWLSRERTYRVTAPPPLTLV